MGGQGRVSPYHHRRLTRSTVHVIDSQGCISQVIIPGHWDAGVLYHYLSDGVHLERACVVSRAKPRRALTADNLFKEDSPGVECPNSSTSGAWGFTWEQEDEDQHDRATWCPTTKGPKVHPHEDTSQYLRQG